MDPIRNPYAPGAGTPPPELAGRDALLEQCRIALERLRVGNSARSILMVGLRGVGKTVLLEHLRVNAEAIGCHTISIEARENRSLPALIAPQLRKALLRLSALEKARDLAQKSLRTLAGFIKSLKLKYNDIELTLDSDAEPGVADTGDLKNDLCDLLEQVGLAAREGGTALALFIDELQCIDEDQINDFLAALHFCNRRNLPILLIGAGLPQLVPVMGDTATYCERMFVFDNIKPLSPDAARDAIEKPALAEEVAFEPDALQRIVEQTQGYPYFLQEWGKHVWDIAQDSPITRKDVELATQDVLRALDDSFFRVRFDRLTQAERKYLRAMATLGPGPHRSGDIAAVLGRRVNDFGPVRQSLLTKGMIWSPHHGETAFTVPLFDDFMTRTMPNDE